MSEALSVVYGCKIYAEVDVSMVVLIVHELCFGCGHESSTYAFEDVDDQGRLTSVKRRKSKPPQFPDFQVARGATS